jgi:1-aminocyclopropane-1-carboxylate deaminase/D-cysteine desulfhydrase-like pyridoxal-dependent ACC family enzyme
MHKHSESCFDTSFLRLPSPVEKIHDNLLEQKKVRLFVKRDDLIHPQLQGNKWRKLKYNLLRARQQGYHTLLTFGGAYSNHIHATAAAGNLFNFRTIGIVRGEAYQPLNPTLEDASRWGMQLNYVCRQAYRDKTSETFIAELHRQYGDFYLIPEGGNNSEGMRGCTEIITELERSYDVICVDCGTGTTMAGLVSSAPECTRVLGFSVLKNAGFLLDDVSRLLSLQTTNTDVDWDINFDFHFGGFAKTSAQLLEFIRCFKQQHDMQLEPVYSGKMFYGIYQLLKEDFFPQKTDILAIHSGGLQGLRGFKNL